MQVFKKLSSFNLVSQIADLNENLILGRKWAQVTWIQAYLVSVRKAGVNL